MTFATKKELNAEDAVKYMSKYRLKCWKAPDDMATTFCQEEGTLFFSELFYKWKDSVPTQKWEKVHKSSWEHYCRSKPTIAIYNDDNIDS